MASLVACYTDSSDEDHREHEDDDRHRHIAAPAAVDAAQRGASFDELERMAQLPPSSGSATADSPAVAADAAVNFFNVDASDSDDDGNTDAASGAGGAFSRRGTSELQQRKRRLPNPLLDREPTFAAGSAASVAPVRGGVFSNPYLLKEQAKHAILEKHVKMTETKTSSKPVCFKFKKGRCSKGKNCPFLHDAGLVRPPPQHQTDEAEEAVAGFGSDGTAASAAFSGSADGYGFGSGSGSSRRRRDLDDDRDDEGQRRPLPRPGVTDTLQPAKRAKAALAKQLASESPWM